MKYVVSRNNEILDAIVYNYYGESFGYLEMVLSANTFLYEQEIFLTEGLIITLPEIELKTQNRVKLV
jgi:phage tail protein X